MTLRTLNQGNHGFFLFVGNAGFLLSAVVFRIEGSGTHGPEPLEYQEFLAGTRLGRLRVRVVPRGIT